MGLRLKDVAPAALLIGAESGAVVALQRLGHVAGLEVPFSDLQTWLESTDPELVTAASARVVALALASWLLCTTLLYAAAQMLRREVLIGIVGALTLPAARRTLDRAVVTSLLATALLVRAPAATAGPIADSTQISVEPRSGRLDSAPASRAGSVRVGRAAPPLDRSHTQAATPAPPEAPTPEPPPRSNPVFPVPASRLPRPNSGTYVVVSGESLWTIAARQVAGAERAASDVPAAEIAPYWQALVALNQGVLRSGDPDLIFPGEILRLPQTFGPSR
ncbi:MAG: LysM peptidoglycan-binding domain-containing protein [Acidimicrobiia bacterium]